MFFGILVSEWNPCYADDGMGCRYTWDDETGAHDVEVQVEKGGSEVAPITSERVLFEMFRLAGRSVCDCVLFWMMSLVHLRKKLLILTFNVSEDLPVLW